MKWYKSDPLSSRKVKKENQCNTNQLIKKPGKDHKTKGSTLILQIEIKANDKIVNCNCLKYKFSFCSFDALILTMFCIFSTKIHKKNEFHHLIIRN